MPKATPSVRPMTKTGRGKPPKTQGEAERVEVETPTATEAETEDVQADTPAQAEQVETPEVTPEEKQAETEEVETEGVQAEEVQADTEAAEAEEVQADEVLADEEYDPVFTVEELLAFHGYAPFRAGRIKALLGTAPRPYSQWKTDLERVGG